MIIHVGLNPLSLPFTGGFGRGANSNFAHIREVHAFISMLFDSVV